MVTVTWWVAAIIAAIPSGVTGLGFWLIQRQLNKHDEKLDEREKARLKNEVMLVQKVDASLCLGEATARAVQRIPDAHCNGDMHAALEYAQKIKREHRQFMTEQGVQQLYE